MGYGAGMSSTKSISSAAAALGSVSSPAKTAAARQNGQLGGRPSPYRRVRAQRTNASEVYAAPDTAHWAGWRDADAVHAHGEFAARLAKKDGPEDKDGLPRWRKGQWLDSDYRPVSADLQRQFSRLKSIGITTR